MTAATAGVRRRIMPGESADVDCSIIHRPARADLLISDGARTGPDSWVFGLQMPRGHWSSRQDPSRVPLNLGLEAIRQMGFSLGHLHSGIPLDWSFMLHRISFAWNDPAAADFSGFEPFNAEAFVRVSPVTERNGGHSRLSADCRIYRNGSFVATGAGDLAGIPRPVYRRIRAGAAAPPPEVRRRDDAVLRDVARSDDRLEAALGLDWADPFFFDHPIDHVPALLLSEAALESHRLIVGKHPTGVTMECSRYVEFFQDALVRSRRIPDGGTICSIVQNGEVAAEIRCN
jgi:2-oxo-3-(phosphooxy)propyl 3-oxoalkanoate synthase